MVGKTRGTSGQIEAMPQNCIKGMTLQCHVLSVPFLLKHVLEESGKTDFVISTREFTWDSILPERMTYIYDYSNRYL